MRAVRRSAMVVGVTVPRHQPLLWGDALLPKGRPLLHHHWQPGNLTTWSNWRGKHRKLITFFPSLRITCLHFSISQDPYGVRLETLWIPFKGLILKISSTSILVAPSKQLEWLWRWRYLALAYCCLRGCLELWSSVASEVESIYYAATYLHLASRPNAQGVKSGGQAAISTFEWQRASWILK